jgi:hypothetical protein
VRSQRSYIGEGMKRLLFLLLMTTCSVSWAEWEKTGASVDGDEVTVYYLDKSTIRKNGVIVKMWVMVSTTELVSTTGRSSKAQKVYDCSSEKFALASLVMYSGPMGTGKVTTSMTFKEKEWEWTPIVPDSGVEFEWKVACRKK